MDEKELLRQAMSIMGKRKSEKKAAAVRENGKKGGRPPKPKPEQPEEQSQSEAA